MLSVYDCDDGKVMLYIQKGLAQERHDWHALTRLAIKGNSATSPIAVLHNSWEHMGHKASQKSILQGKNLGHGLKQAYGFAKTHLVSQNAIEAVLVQRDEPAHPPQLVVAHLTLHQRQHALQLTTASSVLIADA